MYMRYNPKKTISMYFLFNLLTHRRRLYRQQHCLSLCLHLVYQ